MSDSADLTRGCVTAIRRQAKSPDRVAVFLDGAFAFGMHRDLLLEFDVRKGIDLDVDTQLAIRRRDGFFRARAVAFRFLSYRVRTETEMRRRLEKAEYSVDVVDDVIHYLQKLRLVDDAAYALQFAEARFASGGYGPRRVRADLQKKGVPQPVADAAIENVFGERSEVVDRARELGRKRWERLKRETDDRKRKKKVYDYLARRGFSYDMVHLVVNELNRNSTSD